MTPLQFVFLHLNFEKKNWCT